MLKENKETIKQIIKYQHQLIPSGFHLFNRGCGKTNLELRILEIYNAYEIMKDYIIQSTKYISFQDINNMVIDMLSEEEGGKDDTVQ